MRVQLANIELNKLESAKKNKTGTTLRSNNKNLKVKNIHMDYF